MKDRSGLEANDHWATPKWLYDKLNAEFHFSDFDPCPLYATFDGLAMDEWPGERIFINPPYNSRDKPRFVEKALQQSTRFDKTCVLLIPAATSTELFHEVIVPNGRVRLLRGRIKFDRIGLLGEVIPSKTGMHDSMLVIFGGSERAGPITTFDIRVET